MYSTHRYTVAITVAAIFAAPFAIADTETRWRGYSVVDERTGQLIYGATKSYIVSLEDGGGLERRIGFQCINGLPVFTFDLGEFLAPGSTDFELVLWVDQNDPIAMDMRVWQNGTNGGFSRVEVIAEDLFYAMLPGIQLYWRLGGFAGETDGTFSLIGFTSATREFASNCSLEQNPDDEEGTT